MTSWQFHLRGPDSKPRKLVLRSALSLACGMTPSVVAKFRRQARREGWRLVRFQITKEES